jgi:hypothetical protein
LLHALDVVIGLSAVYTAFSLLASWINETLNSVTCLRATTLKDGIEQMVGDATLHAQLYNQPTIKAAQSKSERDPSYLSANQFSLAVMSLLNEGADGQAGQTTFSAVVHGVDALPPSTLKGALSAILSESDAKLGSFVSGVESWFDSEMDRVSGWYKRHVQIWIFIIGIILAGAFNVDTVRLVHTFTSAPLDLNISKLQGDSTQAQQYVSEAVFSHVALGWRDPTYCFNGATGSRTVTSMAPCWDWNPSIGWFFNKIVGILLSAIALSLGAPFWFDTLSRFVNVRGAGPPPQSSQSDS